MSYRCHPNSYLRKFTGKIENAIEKPIERKFLLIPWSTMLFLNREGRLQIIHAEKH